MVDENSRWLIQNPIDLDLDGETIYSLGYHPDGKSILVGTSDFNLFRIRTEDGAKIWKSPAKMMFQKEFDGPEIFDVSLDGKTFLSFDQTNREIQSSERFLVVRSAENGKILKRFPVENSTFHSITAAIDYRYPGPEEEKRRIESELGFNWILTIDKAVFIEGGKKILATYKHNMDGPNFYDRKFIFYETTSSKKLNEYQIISDPATANWDQPAGFEIAHFNLPFVYSEKRKAIIYGNSHGRVILVNETTLQKNKQAPLVENKFVGEILFIPKSDSDELETKDRQSIRSLTLSPDGRYLFLSAGYEQGFIQFHVIDLDLKKEIYKSSKAELGEMKSPSNQYLVASGYKSSNDFFLLDSQEGKILFSSELSDPPIGVRTFSINPKWKEILLLSGANKVTFIRPAGNMNVW